MISTHTLRGERDMHSIFNTKKRKRFQLTRSVGSVTIHIHPSCVNVINFNSHAPWGA